MSGAADLLARLSPAAAERVAREYLVSLLSGEISPGEHPGVSDLRSLPLNERNLDAIVKGLAVGGRTNAGMPTYSRALLADIVDPALQVVSKSYPLPAHRQFCKILTAPDFRPSKYIAAIDGLDVQEIGELGEYPTINEHAFEGNAETVSLRTFGRIAQISRQTATNDATCGYFRDLGAALVAACFRKEAALVYGALEANPLLSDGDNWFNASNTETAVNVATVLERAFAKFAGQTFSNGEYVGAIPTVLIVPPSWSLYTDDFTSDLVIQRPFLIKSPYVSSGYMLAGASCPSIGLVGLDQALIPQLETNPRPPSNLDIALQLKVRHTFAVLPLQRAGVVKLAVGE